ncbi:MAG: aldose 1-epimerase family protein, partial [Lachnospiraceae bacterium]|nr:aldose 1-epimerase family protein [Lachnospiraceae bacterium]
MKITIRSQDAVVTCQTHGAELLSYQTAAGKEYLWQKDPAYWAKTSPVLFPYIG